MTDVKDTRTLTLEGGLKVLNAAMLRTTELPPSEYQRVYM
jgi:hypothetical protein